MYLTQKQGETNIQEETKNEEIKIRLILNVAFKSKDYAKIAKLSWNPNFKYWFYDKLFANIIEFREFINDDEKEFNFPVDSIFDFKVMRIDSEHDFEGDEYEKLFQKYFKFQNLYIQTKS